MRKILIILMILTCTIIAFATPTKSSKKTPKQNNVVKSINFNGKKYYLKYSAGNNQEWLNEYLPNGMTFDNYTEMFTVRSYDGIEATPDQIANFIVSNLLKKYPDSPYNLVKGIHPNEKEISFAIATSSVREFNLFRIVPGKNGYPISLQYVRRDLLSTTNSAKGQQEKDKLVSDLQNNFDKWLQSIRNMAVPAMVRTPIKEETTSLPKTPIIMAIKQNNVPLALKLIKEDADVNEVDPATKKTALMFAVDKKQFTVIDALIAAKANINATDNHKNTTLMRAIGTNNIDAVKVLIAKGANVNMPNDLTNPPLLVASYAGQLEIVQLLLGAGAKVDATNNQLITPLMLASEKGHCSIVRALLAAGANVNARDIAKTNPLMYAATGGNLETVQILLKAKADVNASDKDQFTALIYASKKGNSQVVQSLIKAGADVNATDKNKKTARDYAKQRDFFTIMDMLLEAGAKP